MSKYSTSSAAPTRPEEDEEEIETSRPTRASSSDDSDDEDDELDMSQVRKALRGGWSNAEKVVQSSSAYAQRLRVDDEPVIVKFLDDEPYTSYRQHWITRPGQKSWTCLQEIDPRGCPLCAAGDRPSARFGHNVALLAHGEDPVVRSYEYGSRVMDTLRKLAQDPRQGPLTKHYWSIRKAGQGNQSIQLIKTRDLTEDWSLDALTDEELETLMASRYDETIVQLPRRKTLVELVDELGLTED